MNNDLEKFSEERLKDMQKHVTAGMTLGHADALLIRQAIDIALAVKQAKPTFEEWMSNQSENIEVDCGCVTTEAFYHWLKVAYEATPQPAHTEQDGWIKCSDRMPDSKNDVQLFCSYTREQFVGFHRGNGMFQFFNMNDVIGECEPTHWMPLPAAPKPESE